MKQLYFDAMKPIEIRRVPGSGLQITWEDGAREELSAEALRKNCPCANCRDARGEDAHATPLDKPKKRSLAIVTSTLAEETTLTEIWAVGNYALGVRWADGHATGIYSFPYLKSLYEQTKN